MINIVKRFKSNRLGIFALCLLSVILFMAMFGPFFSGYGYDQTHLSLKNSPPSIMFWFGTDDLGRDLFTRVCYGARISLFIGVCAAFIDLLIGFLWGSVAALAGGKVDEVMMRVADILYAIPYLLIVILLMVILGPGMPSILAALTVIGWITMARLIRGKMLQLKTQEFVIASRALGASQWHILKTHLLPNAIGTVIVALTFTIPSAIFSEAFLSFLGLGIQAPIASWGSMVNDGLSAMHYYPWRLFFPATMISLTLLAFNLVGDALCDATDSRS